MGTGGSRWGAGRPAYRPAANNYRKLDIRRMIKANCIKPHNWFGWQWTNDAGEQVASVNCKVNPEADGLTVTYRWKNSYETEWQSVDKHVWLASTACNYGGVRQWFRCPCCQRRAAVLYVMGGALRCARCGRLSYASQRGDAMNRAWIKQQKIEAKLIDGWQKPKHMRWKTFERLQGKIGECERQRDKALMVAMVRLGIKF